jgi:D-glycerate 3-kinase
MYSQLVKKIAQIESLPSSYVSDALRYFIPLAKVIAKKIMQSSTPVVIGISGAQGTGKTTLNYLLSQLLTEQKFKIAQFSLDDFYLTKNERNLLASQEHPLLCTRGVPGTHDTSMLLTKLNGLLHQTENQKINIPKFNKADDERVPKGNWSKVKGSVDAIFMDGWFVGATPLDPKMLEDPINELEKTEDITCEWRNFINEQLSGNYQKIFSQINFLIFLEAPSFSQIYGWRQLQEEKLRKRNPKAHALMDDDQLFRFIQHYERLTQHCLSILPELADAIFLLDSDHRITNCSSLS